MVEPENLKKSEIISQFSATPLETVFNKISFLNDSGDNVNIVYPPLKSNTNALDYLDSSSIFSNHPIIPNCRPLSPENIASLLSKASKNRCGTFESFYTESMAFAGFFLNVANLFTYEGVYVLKQPEIKDGKVNIDPSKIDDRLEKLDANFKFVKYGFKTGYLTSKEFIENEFIRAQVGEEGAIQIAELGRGLGLFLESMVSYYNQVRLTHLNFNYEPFFQQEDDLVFSTIRNTTDSGYVLSEILDGVCLPIK